MMVGGGVLVMIHSFIHSSPGFFFRESIEIVKLNNFLLSCNVSFVIPGCLSFARFIHSIPKRLLLRDKKSHHLPSRDQ